MAKLDGRMLDIDLDVVVDANGHQLIRDGEQSFGGVKTFDAPPLSLMSKAEVNNTAVTKAMLQNATRCVNTIFNEVLTVTETDISNGYVALSKEIPSGKESSLEIVSYEGAGPLVCGVDFGAETKKLILTGYDLERVVTAGDELEVQYMICDDVIVTLESVEKIMYAPELGENGLFVAFGSGAIYYSEDGVDWTKAVEVDGGLNSADYSPELRRFVASYGSGYLVSDDGKEWTKYE